MTVNTPDSETRNRRRLLMAAAAVVVVIGVAGIALLNNGADDDQPPAATAVPTVAPTATVAPTTVATKTVSWGVASANDIPVTFTAPENWGEFEGWSAYSDDSGVGDGAFVLFDGNITNIYTDGCQWTLLDPPVGPTVDDLVAAWADVPELAATAAVDITVDGYPGKQIEFTLPDYTPSECKQQAGNSDGDGQFGIYMSEGAVPPGQWAQNPGPNSHWQMWVLDVDGTRLLIAAGTFPTTSPEDQAELDEVLASIQIG